MPDVFSKNNHRKSLAGIKNVMEGLRLDRESGAHNQEDKTDMMAYKETNVNELLGLHQKLGT